MGPTFVPRAQEDTGAEPAQVARAYTAAREIFAMRALWEHIEGLDNKVPARLQYEAAFQTSRLLRHATYWLLTSRSSGLQVDAAVGEFRDGVRELEAEIAQVLTGPSSCALTKAARATARRACRRARGARRQLEALNAALDIVRSRPRIASGSPRPRACISKSANASL